MRACVFASLGTRAPNGLTREQYESFDSQLLTYVATSRSVFLASVLLMKPCTANCDSHLINVNQKLYREKYSTFES